MVWVGSSTLVKSFDKEGLSNRCENGMCNLGMEMYLKTFSKLVVETYKVALALSMTKYSLIIQLRLFSWSISNKLECPNKVNLKLFCKIYFI
jgi:hypothetical protein